MRDVAGFGGGRDVQALGDRLVRQSADQEAEDLALPAREFDLSIP